jgi:hypothetical protein
MGNFIMLMTKNKLNIFSAANNAASAAAAMASLYGGGPNSSTTLDQLLAAAGITSAGLTGSTTAMPTQSALQLKSGRAMTPQTIIKG